MKTTALVALAGLAATVAAAHDGGFAVLHFNDGTDGKELFKGRADPIGDQGVVSRHCHSVMGGSNFGLDMTADELLQSDCTNAKVNGDFSNYWVPSLFFHDKATGKFEGVNMYYMNVYYFFDKTDDDIVAFPPGLRMMTGDTSARTPPAAGGNLNLDPSKGEVNGVQWTCPRNNYNEPAYPVDSDGSAAGIADSGNKGAGTGFPLVPCDALYSPLRADIHMPSCYNPAAGLDDYRSNMAYPITTDGRSNCPDGWTHVPHLFFEIYWDTQAFSDRWTPDGVSQPFVLSNGDATGYSLHADFFAAWEPDVLQTIIDTCNAGTSGMDKCPILPRGENKAQCGSKLDLGETVSGVLDILPGSNPLQGFGATPPAPVVDAPAPAPDAADTPTYSDAAPTSAPSSSVAPPPADVVSAGGPSPAVVVVPSAFLDPFSSAPVEEQPSSSAGPVVSSVLSAAPVAVDEPQCTTRTHTVWETVTEYAAAETNASAEETNAPVVGSGSYDDGAGKAPSRRARRHVHKHLGRNSS